MSMSPIHHPIQGFSRPIHHVRPEILACCLVIWVFIGCGVPSQPQAEIPAAASRESLTTFDSTWSESGVMVRVVVNDPGGKQDLLLLPGWNFPIRHWEDSTRVLELAAQGGWNVVMPEMKKSIYHLQTYPDTRKDWRSEKGLPWLADTLIPKLQLEFGILLPEHRVKVMGLSTGGRGAVALAVYKRGLVGEVVSLSGDFSTLQFPNDNLYRGYFGELRDHEDIWQAEDLCLASLPSGVKVLLVHGEEDDVVPILHSELLSKSLTDRKHPCGFKRIPGAGHSYALWAAWIDSALTR
jgi:pimeloyl-ACP methyl ester carboxylesterase